MTTRDPDQLETLDTVAAELSVSYEQARTLTIRGKLPYVDVGTGKKNKCRRVRRADLDAFKRNTRRDDPDREFQRARAIAWVSSGRGGYI